MSILAFATASTAAAASTVASTAAAATESIPSEEVSKAVTQAAATAGAIGGIVALTLTTLMIFGLVWFVLQVIADWMIFSKAGQPGWKSIIPIYNVYVEYELCWSGVFGIIFMALSVISALITSGPNPPVWKTVLEIIIGVSGLVIHFKESVKLSRAFGKGIGYGIVMFLFGPIGRLILAFGGSTYQGPQ